MSDLDSLRRAVEKSPSDIPLLLLLGQGLVDTGELEEALASYTRVLELEPAQHDAQLGIAQILFQKGMVSEAAVRAEAILENDSHFARAHLLLSRLHLAEDSKRQAIEEYRLALEADRSLADKSFEQDLGLAHSKGAKITVEGGAATTNNEFGHYPEGMEYDEASSIEAEDDVLAEPEHPTCRFSDVGGLDELKRELRRRWVTPLQHPDLASAFKVTAGGGVLLYGPPGCGKTLLAEAVAGEVGCRLIRVGIHDILDPYFGSSERNLHQVFEIAREEAPILLLIDHIDTIAGDRQRLRDNQARSLVNQLLNELHTTSNKGERVLVVGCTDTPWHLDRAFLRPGHFGKPLFIPPPSRKERQEILQLFASSRPTGIVDVDALASATRGFSGADLKAIFDLATEQALEEAALGHEFQPLDTLALMRARNAVQPSTATWFRTAQKSLSRNQDDEIFAAVREAVTDNRHA